VGRAGPCPSPYYFWEDQRQRTNEKRRPSSALALAPEINLKNKKAKKMIVGEAADDFYLPDDEVSLPSERDGVPRAAERDARMLGAALIQEAAALLDFPQAVAAAGQILMHRFFCRRSVRDYSVQKAAAACLWLAAKLEEVPDVSQHPAALVHKVMLVFDRRCARRERAERRRERRREAGAGAAPTNGAAADDAADAAAAADDAADGDDPPPPVLERHSREYLALRDSLVRYEREVLRACGYVCAAEPPHKLALGLLRAARLDHGARGAALAAGAWAAANDSLRTTLCVRVRPLGVACGVIFVAARRLALPMPGEGEGWGEPDAGAAGEEGGGGGGSGGAETTTPPWYEVFGATAEEVATVAREMHALYTHPTVLAAAAAAEGPADGGGGGGPRAAAAEGPAAEDGGGDPGATGRRPPGGAEGADATEEDERGDERPGKRPALAG